MTARPLHPAALLILLLAAAPALAGAAVSNEPVAVPPARAIKSHAVVHAAHHHTAAPPVPAFSAPQENLPLGQVAPAPPDSAFDSRTGSAAIETVKLPANTGAGVSTAAWVFQTAAALALVIGLIVLLRVWLQKLGGRTGAIGGRLVEVLGRSSIGPRTQVLFLRINSRVVVVGQTPAGLSTLTTLDQPDDVAWVLGQIQSSRPLSITAGFRSLLNRFEGSFDTAADEGGDDAEHAVDRTRDRLSGLITRIRSMKDNPPGGRP